MLIHKIENRLDEEKYVNKFLNQLDNNMERVQKEIDSVFAKAQKNGKWSRAEVYKYNRMKKLKQNLRQIHGKYQAKFKNDFRNVLTGLYKDETHWMQGLLKNQKNLAIPKFFWFLSNPCIQCVSSLYKPVKTFLKSFLNLA